MSTQETPRDEYETACTCRVRDGIPCPLQAQHDKRPGGWLEHEPQGAGPVSPRERAQAQASLDEAREAMGSWWRGPAPRDPDGYMRAQEALSRAQEALRGWEAKGASE